MLLRSGSVLVMGCALLAIASGCRGERTTSGLASGGQAYLAQCAVCHGTAGQGDGPLVATIAGSRGTLPPSLHTERITSIGREGVHRAIESEAHLRPGSNMPAWGAPLGSVWMDRVTTFVMAIPNAEDAQRVALARYLEPPPGTLPAGRKAYVLYCSGCHGPWGGGDGFFAAGQATRPANLRGKALGTLDDSELMEILSLGGAHAPEAATIPSWLHTLSPEDHQALAVYLRTLAGPSEESKSD